MKVVLDTNVVVSGAFFGGPPRAVLDAWIDGRLHLILSPSIFDEYVTVCDRLSAAYPGTDYRRLLTEFVAQGTLLPDLAHKVPVTADLDDDKFMLCASRADAVVVSGDRHLHAVNGWRGVRVLTPAGILAEISG